MTKERAEYEQKMMKQADAIEKRYKEIRKSFIKPKKQRKTLYLNSETNSYYYA